LEYLERELAGLKLDAEQKGLFRELMKDEQPSQDKYKELISSLQTKNQGNHRALK
jgi:hypothetical protein